MLKIRDPNTRALVSGLVALLSFFFFMGLFGVYQDNLTLREQMIAAKPAVFISFILSGLIYFGFAFTTKLDGDVIEAIETEATVTRDELEIRNDIKRLQLALDDIPESDPMTEKVETIIEVVRESLKEIKKKLEIEDITDIQDLKLTLKDTADGIEIYRDRIERVRIKPELKAKIQEDREKMPTILLGFLTILDKVSPDTIENTALKQAEIKMRAWGYVSQLTELEMKKKLRKGVQ